MFPNSGWGRVGSITLSQKQREILRAESPVNTAPKKVNVNVMLFARKEIASDFLGCKTYLFSLTSKGTFHQWSVTCLLVEIVMKSYKDHAPVKKWRNLSCFIKTNPYFQWLLCITVALIWFITLFIPLICFPAWLGTINTGIITSYMLVIYWPAGRSLLHQWEPSNSTPI